MADTSDTSIPEDYPTVGEMIRQVVDAANENLAALARSAKDTPEQSR